MNSIPGSPVDCVVVPPDANAILRSKLAPGSPRRLRMAYVTGPGDVVGTFGYWRNGLHDPRVPVVTYSNMFYSLVQKVDAEALILHQHHSPAVPESDTFRFKCVLRGARAGRIAYLLEGRRFARLILRELLAYDPDVVVIGSDVPPALLRAIPRGKSVVLSVHNSFWPMGRRPVSLLQRLQFKLLAWSLGRASGAVCTSAECLLQLASLREDDSCLFVETPQWPEQIPNDLVARTGRLNRLLYAGRVEKNKGIFDLLDAFNILSGRYPELTLTIAGSGSAQPELARRVAASPAAGRIFQLGQLPAAELRKEFGRADLLVCPTRSDFNEGLALVVVEAAASGTPSIASSVVPAKDLVGDACLAFEADDTTALCNAIDMAIGDPARLQRMRQATRSVMHQMTDRSRSWGSRLFQAMIC